MFTPNTNQMNVDFTLKLSQELQFNFNDSFLFKGRGRIKEIEIQKEVEM